MPSPSVQIKDGAGAYQATTNGVNVTPGNVVTINLISTADVQSWLCDCLYTDDLSDAPTVTASMTIDPVAKTATLVAPVAGRKYIFRSRINGGIGPDNLPTSTYTTTFAVCTLTAGGARVLAANETLESDPIFGWIGPLNAQIRTPAAGAGVCTLEIFGAKGDGVLDDTAAFDAASNAIRAGTFNVLLLGAKTYLVNPTTNWPLGGSIVGQGASSVLKTTANRPVVLAYDSTTGNRIKTITFKDFMIVGSIGTNPSYTSQDGIDIGYYSADGASRVTVSNVVVKNLAGAGLVSSSADDFAFGPLFLGCLADGCWKGIVGATPGSAVGCHVVNCTNTGISVGGNFTVSGGSIKGCALGMYVGSGGNDGHANIVGVSFLHNLPTQVQIATGLINGEFFSGCRFYEGALIVPNGITRAVTFGNCTFDLTSWTLQGKVRLLACSFDDGYANTLTSITGGEIEFVNPRALKMSIPAWIGGITYPSYSFPSDANQTLASQVAWAQALTIAAGTITASRTLTLGNRPPSLGNLIRVKNRTAYALTIQWATGTGVSVAAGSTSTIGADGTNAIDWSDGINASVTVDPVTLVLAGFWRGSFSGAPWVGTASAGLSGSHNITGGGGAGTGSAVNGFTPATFNGTSNTLIDSTNAPLYLTTTDYTVSGVAYFNAALTAGTVYNMPGIVTESGGNWGVVYDSSGIRVYHASTSVLTIPCTTGGWRAFDIVFTGGVLKGRIGNGAWVTASGVAATGSLTTASLRVGANYANAVFLNASVMELQMSLVAISDPNLNGQYAFRQARYPAMGL